jgi:succinoglycan biosynthesis transport protein ExoP
MPKSAATALDEIEEAEKPLEFLGYLYALLHRSWLIALFAVAGGLIAMWYLQLQPQLYRSTTVIEIEMEEQKAMKLKDDTQPITQGPEVIQTIMSNLRNRSLMERVIQALHLTTDPVFLGHPVKEPAPLDDAVKILLHDSEVTLRKNTRLVDVSYSHRDPATARRISGALVTQFIELGEQQRLESLETQNSVLVKKASDLKEKLDRSEHAIQDYKKNLESVSLEENRNLVDVKLKGLNADLTTAKGERLRIEADLNQIQKAHDDVKALQLITSVVQDSEVLASQSRVDAAEGELATFAQRYRDKHPSMIGARAKVQAARTALAESIRTAPDRVTARYNSAISREQGLQTAVADQEKALLELDEKVIPFRALQRDMESDKALFESVLQRLKESNLSVSIQPVSFRIVEPAVPARPVPMKRPEIISLAAVAGMMLAAGLIAAFFFLDSSLRTVDETERLIGMPVLAAIPIIEKLKHPRDALVMRYASDSGPAESFRSLRSAVSLLGPEHERSVLLMTSAIPGEGKTTVSGNIAIAFAQQGLRTLLIDADLRRPALTKLFEVVGETGVAEYIATGNLTLIPSGVDNLSLIPSGAHAPNPAELLANPRFGQLIELMKQRFDRIVIDSAPLNVVSDTFSFVDMASTICVVVRANKSPRKVVRRALELLSRARVRPAGLILNCLPKTHGAGYYYYYSSNSKYGSGGTYGSEHRAAHRNGAAATRTNGSGANGTAAAHPRVAEPVPAEPRRTGPRAGRETGEPLHPLETEPLAKEAPTPPTPRP